MMEVTTDSIRALAVRWSLAGDDQLLTLLQNTHQKIISKCQEVNTQLDTMASALDEASINLQNVNNKFMALSNSQFIESRVYDDDADVSIESKQIPPEEPPEPEAVDEIALLKQSLAILDNAHETAEIVDDSDTDDSDAQISVVLKAKDAYSDRPLPYIIGSQAWKNKWHAGLVIEESDSDSSTSRQDVREIEQYSDSDDDVRTDKHLRTTLSESSSSFSSNREPSVPENKVHIPEVKSPAAVAAELAARLGQIPRQVIEEPVVAAPQPVKTIYRPQKPISSTIFSDEPPPLPSLDPQDGYSSESNDDDDIFAEINKQQPYNNSNRVYNDDVFGRTVPNDFVNKVETRNAKQKTTLFEDESEPELFAETPQPKDNKVDSQSKNKYENDNTTKKPVGGISLFGSNKGTESIGAAILNRNRRKSSTTDSEDDSGRNTIKNDPAVAKDEGDNNTNNPNYIFDNLFAKAKLAEQKAAKSAKIDRSVKEEVKDKPKEIKDLFSDNLFDDMDDIFTSNIKIPPKQAAKNVKSIFDDDDLFSDITKEAPKDNQPTSSKVASSSAKKNIFDSDDDLFGDIKTTKNKSTTKTIKSDDKTRIAESESQNNKPSTSTKSTKEDNNNIREARPPENRTIFDDSKQQKAKAKSKSIFDSDSDDNLFSEVKNKIAKTKIPEFKNSINIDTETDTELFKGKIETKEPETLKAIEKPKVFESPSLFEEDEIDDLFINANKAKDIAKNTNKSDNIDATINVQGLINKPQIKEDNSEFNDHKVQDDNNSKLNKERHKEAEKLVQTKSEVSTIIDNKIQSNKLFDGDLPKDDIFTKSEETESEKSLETENNFNDEVIETSQESVSVQSKSISIRTTVDPKMQEPDYLVDNIGIETENKTLNLEQGESYSSYKDNINKLHKENEPIFDEVLVKEKQDLLFKEKKPVSIAAAFDDIFNEPPAFEKTKETKKTTNVNALFDDDSDDEALFFKKNDVISDEKPEIFSPSADFGIFNDEPPDFDVDFNTKSTKNDEDDLFTSPPKSNQNRYTIQNEPPELDEWDEPTNNTLFTKTKETGKIIPSEPESNLFSASEITKTKETLKIIPNEPDSNLLSREINKETKPIHKEISKNITNPDDDLFINIKATVTCQKPQINKVDEPKEINKDEVAEKPDITKDTDKKIGKINTKNFNINVEALVPGSSPRKIPKECTNTDKENVGDKNKQTEENKKEIIESKSEVDNTEPKVKTISFESKPESVILDNNVSKQRARIQVKRRPSSRRARHEAVRKSVIDIDDDTDNSSSFDEPKPVNLDSKDKNKQSFLKDESKDINKKENGVEYKKVTLIDKVSNENKTEEVKVENPIQNVDEKESKTHVTKEENAINIHKEITKDIKTDKIDSDEVDFVKTNKEFLPKTPKNEEKVQTSPQSTTKIVYVLNDEDIFNNKVENPKVNEEILQNEDDDDDIFKKIQTTANTYKDSKITEENTEHTDAKSTKNIEPIKTDTGPSKRVQPQAKSLFDLSDDEDELFGKSTKTKKVEIKSKLFDSDSEDDLFGGKKDKEKVATTVKDIRNNTVKEIKKKSLFGDDDDNDLFGVQTTTTSSERTRIPTSTKSTTKDTTTSTEVVFDDPLSMLDDD